MGGRFSTTREALFFLTRPSLWWRKSLEVVDLDPDPVGQFRKWFQEAERQWGCEFVNWCCVSSLNSDGYPQGRIVLMKDFDELGFVFYTNVESNKGKEMLAHPKASMTFYWERLQHQVRITGDIERVDDVEADAYFASRPRGSQIGAWASEQSRVISREGELEERVRQFSAKYPGSEIPRPPHWTGLRLKPIRFEFWELRLNRLHDRFVYRPSESGWSIEKLYP